MASITAKQCPPCQARAGHSEINYDQSEIEPITDCSPAVPGDELTVNRNQRGIDPCPQVKADGMALDGTAVGAPKRDERACYMPKADDYMPAKKDHAMGPIGPWATGRVDWGPLAGMTGTRPIVDQYSITRYSEGEWRRHNKDLLNKGDSAMQETYRNSYNSKNAMSEIFAIADKNAADNANRMVNRTQELNRWKTELERAIFAMSEEVQVLEEQRRRLKGAGSVLKIPESIVSECIERRSGRMEPDLVRDNVEEELIRELALIKEINDLFERTLKDVEMQLVANKTAKARLECDWSDKQQSFEIDTLNCSLTIKSNIILFKPGATRLGPQQSTLEHWEHFTRETLNEGEAVRQQSVTLRGTLDAILMNAARDLREQADRVDLAFAERINCNEEFRLRLENDLKTCLDRLASTETLIECLKDSLRRNDNAMKVAQTRLDNRLQRPRVENCRDGPCFGLIDEVKSLADGVTALKVQLAEAEKCKAEALLARSNYEREIMIKRKTLQIDRDRCQWMRSHYPSAAALSGH
ncbi:tektin-4-like [Ctenocephalides felis]|uniref:tektin-4-like n=1 Tax=Ctenocephalides felis TaxID=7515 RepID=UPI000E6E35D4|nr:tektin-4-like [Ctenocephalides felis]